MSLATSSPAWNLSTDSHQIIRPLPPRSHTDEPRTGSLYRRFYIVGTAGTCLAGLTLVVYPLAAFGYEIHRVLLTLLMVAMIAGAVVGAIAFMTVLAVRTVDRLCARRLAAMRAELGYDLAATAGRYAKLVELPDSVRTQVDRQGKAYAAMVGQIRSGQAELGERVLVAMEEIRQRLEAVERAVEERDVSIDVLRGVAAWAMDIDQRLTVVQSTLRKDDGGCEVPAKSNGHKESSPMELSDEAMRGYFLGFYDRQANAPDADGN